MTLERMSETIVAPITSIGGAVAIIRVSGPRAQWIASVVFLDWPSTPSPRQMNYGRFVTGDDGFAVAFSPEKSFTGEESVEFFIHGSQASVSMLVKSCVENGSRIADPGEFSLRAFMHGRIDLTEAEGIRDTVVARTEAQLRQANLLRDGTLRASIEKVRDKLISALAAVEASTDFSEEIGGVDRNIVIKLCDFATTELSGLVSQCSAGRVVREGLVIAIVGLPNAGKSSLFNALVRADRAIVTAIPGTTRDTVEESVSWRGRLVRLIDTAGFRKSENEIEALGIVRSRSAMDNADVVLYVYDAFLGWGIEDDQLLLEISRPVIIVANKCDLVPHPLSGAAVSSTNGTGMDGLIERTLSLFSIDDNAIPLLNGRHEPIVQAAIEAVQHARVTLSNPVPDDLAAVDLRSAIRLLGEVTGETATPDIIERIFSDFCVGK